jgi:TctA family transporter
VVFKQRDIKTSKQVLFSPFVIFSLLGILMIGITYSDYKNRRRTKILDLLLFAITGLIGVFILLLWFATDHEATAQNYNLLWAFALNIFVIGQVARQTPKLWFIKYLKFLVIMLCLLTFHWFVGIQVFAIALLPFLLALAVRYVFLVWYYSKV